MSFLEPGLGKKLLAENIQVSQHDVDKSLRVQEGFSAQRHELMEQEIIYKQRQASFSRIQELKKQLRIEEDRFQELYTDKPVDEKPVKEKRKEFILKNGAWIEL